MPEELENITPQQWQEIIDAALGRMEQLETLVEQAKELLTIGRLHMHQDGNTFTIKQVDEWLKNAKDVMEAGK